MTSSPHTAPDYLSLLGLHRAEFEWAKRDQIRAWIATVVAGLLAAAAVFVPTGGPTYVLALLAVVGEAGKWWWTWCTRRHRDTAERGRRVVVLLKGLGLEISGPDMADLLASFSATPPEGKKWEDATYFHSVATPSPSTFLALIQESAFWSRHLFVASAKRLWTAAVVAGLVAMSTLLALPYLPDQNSAVIVVKLVCIVLTLILGADLLGMALDYTAAASALKDLDNRLLRLGSGQVGEADVIAAFGDYNATVERAPLILTRIYNRNHNRISTLWAARTAALRR